MNKENNENRQIDRRDKASTRRGSYLEGGAAMRNPVIAIFGLLAVIAVLVLAGGTGLSPNGPASASHNGASNQFDAVVDADTIQSGIQVCKQRPVGTAFDFEVLATDLNAGDGVTWATAGNVGVNFADVSGSPPFSLPGTFADITAGVMDDVTSNLFITGGQATTTTKVAGFTHLATSWSNAPPITDVSAITTNSILARFSLTPLAGADGSLVTIAVTQSTPKDGNVDTLMGSAQVVATAVQPIQIAIGSATCPPANLSVSKTADLSALPLNDGDPSMAINTFTPIPVDVSIGNSSTPSAGATVFDIEHTATAASLGRDTDGNPATDDPDAGSAGDCSITPVGPVVDTGGALSPAGGLVADAPDITFTDNYTVKCTDVSYHWFEVANTVDNLNAIPEADCNDNGPATTTECPSGGSGGTARFVIAVTGVGDADINSLTLNNLAADFPEIAAGVEINASLKAALAGASGLAGGPSTLIRTIRGQETILDLDALVQNTVSDISMDIDVTYTVAYEGGVELNWERIADGSLTAFPFVEFASPLLAHDVNAPLGSAGNCGVNPSGPIDGGSASDSTVKATGLQSSGAAAVTVSSGTDISIKCTKDSFVRDAPDFIDSSDNRVRIHLFSIEANVSPNDVHNLDSDDPVAVDTLQVSNGNFAGVAGLELWVLALDPIDASFNTIVDSSLPAAADICILGTPCNIKSSTSIPAQIPGLDDPLNAPLDPDEDSQPLGGTITITPLEVDVAAGVALPGAAFPFVGAGGSSTFGSGHPGVDNGNVVGELKAIIRTNLEGQLGACAFDDGSGGLTLDVSNPVAFMTTATAVKGLVDGAMPVNQLSAVGGSLSHISATNPAVGLASLLGEPSGITIPTADFTGTVSVASNAGPVTMTDASATFPVDTSPFSPPDPMSLTTLKVGSEELTVVANNATTLVLLSPFSSVPSGGAAYTVDTAGSLANPTVWPERLEDDPVLKSILGGTDFDITTPDNNAPLWYRYVGLALVDTTPGPPFEILVPINFIGVNLGSLGIGSVSVVGDPSVDNPASQLCTPLDASSTILGRAESGTSVPGSGTPAETIRVCNSDSLIVGPIIFAQKIVREDTQGQETLVDANGTCTAKEDAAVLSVSITDQLVDTNITEVVNAAIDVIQNNKVGVSSMDVFLQLRTNDVSLCDATWRSSAGTEVSEAFVGSAKIHTFLSTETIAPLSGVTLDKEFDLLCSTSGVHTDLIELTVTIFPNVADDAPDAFDNTLALDPAADVDADADRDGDGVLSVVDNCRGDDNAGQEDADSDTTSAGDGGLTDGGNVCDDNDDRNDVGTPFGDLVLDVNDDCTPALTDDGTVFALIGTADDLVEDADGVASSDGCPETNASASNGGLTTTIGQPLQIPENTAVVRGMTVNFSNDGSPNGHVARMGRIIQIVSDVNECLVEMTSPSASIAFTDTNPSSPTFGQHTEILDLGTTTEFSSPDSVDVPMTLQVTCAPGGGTITVSTNITPQSPVREEDLSSANQDIDLITFTAGPDPDGDLIPNNIDDCDDLAEDVDGVDDTDGCPGIDTELSALTGGGSLTSYVGNPDTVAVSVTAANESIETEPGEPSASAQISVELSATSLGFATVDWADNPASLTTTGTTALLAQTANEVITKSLRVACTSAGGPTGVLLNANKTGLLPTLTEEEPGETRDNSDGPEVLNVTCFDNDPALGTITTVPSAITNVLFSPPPGSGGSDTSQISQQAINNTGGEDATDIEFQWELSFNAAEVDASWVGAGGTVATHNSGPLTAGSASSASIDTVEVTCLDDSGGGTFDVTINSSIVSTTPTTLLAKDADTGNNIPSAIVTVECELDTDGDGDPDSSDGTPDHDLEVNSTVVTGPGVAVNGGSKVQMWVEHDIENLRDQPENSLVSLSVVGLPSGCTKTGDTTPFQPPINSLKLLNLQTRSITWLVEIECTGVTPAIYSLDITPEVTLVPQVNDGVETTAQEANNTETIVKGLQVVN